MTSPAVTPHEPEAQTQAPPYASQGFWKMVAVVLLLMGFGFALQINGWHFSVPVVVLWFGWAGVLTTIALLWQAGMAVATEASGDHMEELDVSEARHHELVAEKRSLLLAIKEIEFDRDLGKMSESDAKEMMRFYRARAIDVIKELDGQDDEDLSVSDRVQRDLQARLAISNKVIPKKKTDKTEAEESS